MPYTVSDMARDAIAVLDANGIARAHVMGFSMGGMIVQMLAIEHPDRLLSMISVMSTTGDRDVGQSAPEAQALLLAPAPTDRESYIERHLHGIRTWGSPAYYDEERLRPFAGAAFDRCFDPAGQARQVMAIVAESSRTEALREVRFPRSSCTAAPTGWSTRAAAAAQRKRSPVRGSCSSTGWATTIRRNSGTRSSPSSPSTPAPCTGNAPRCSSRYACGGGRISMPHSLPIVVSATGSGRPAPLRSWLGDRSTPPALEFEAMVRVFFADAGTLTQLRRTLEAVEETAETRRRGAASDDRRVAAAGPYEFARRLPVDALVPRFQLDHEALFAQWAHWACTQIETWRSPTDAAGWDWLQALDDRNSALRR